MRVGTTLPRITIEVQNPTVGAIPRAERESIGEMVTHRLRLTAHHARLDGRGLRGLTRPSKHSTHSTLQTLNNEPHCMTIPCTLGTRRIS